MTSPITSALAWPNRLTDAARLPSVSCAPVVMGTRNPPMGPAQAIALRCDEPQPILLQDCTCQGAPHDRARIDSDAVRPHCRLLPWRVAMDHHSPERLLARQEGFADPHQVVACLSVEWDARTYPCVDEEITASLVTGREIPEENQVSLGEIRRPLFRPR